ncbi:alpha/beta hydrolase-fold protein [Streptomyces sp. TRM68416]|uniref:carboxylesterase family protein n=1 Tax=Streptomyces sp. TRM68416 TaxID=2758412 RepID=UPI001661A5A0|nr:alpha/beta hydrolase-fold protein [Streptomyces sp. TRM68416]MBD0843975.1 hypothetical protein [Streptomyces sp. TRM68416]
MKNPTLPRRSFLAATLGAVALGGLTACGSSTDKSASSTASTSGSAAAAAATAKRSADASPPSLESLQSDVKSKFKQFTYNDSETGKSLPYNLFIPEDYDSSKKYPMVLYIADSSLVGKDVTAPLDQYGALIWASEGDQALHKSFVLVPEFPEVILDDHSGYTTTDYVEMTKRLVDTVAKKYRVNAKQIYGTGQSMGGMTVMYLAAKYPTLFAAELFVSCQWDISVLDNLAKETFCYYAAAGDERASGGQTDVEAMLKSAGKKYQTTTDLDATAAASEQNSTVQKMLAKGSDYNFVTFKKGTVLEVSDADSSDPMASSEHMASFEPAYKIAASRDWLFEQKA